MDRIAELRDELVKLDDLIANFDSSYLAIGKGGEREDREMLHMLLSDRSGLEDEYFNLIDEEVSHIEATERGHAYY